ncbi:tetratricopeptide repeat protein [bacterium]|nr:tetratricopeptide repeat protein [bacterium]
MIRKIIQISLLSVLLTSCLKTRSEVAEQDQNAVYGKKNAENQAEAQASNPAIAQEVQGQIAAPIADEKDELIRNLNGRVETLENQLAAIIKEKETTATADSQKIVLLQEALAKMEGQIQRLETELPINKTTDGVLKNIEDTEEVTAEVSQKKLGPYETAQEFFSNKLWKKAILSFNEYTSKYPKGKNVDDAKYKIGVCFEELGMKDEAMAYYEEVAANHAKSDAGKKSKARLTKLKK